MKNNKNQYFLDFLHTTGLSPNGSTRREQTGLNWKRGGGKHTPPPSVFPENIRELCSEYIQNVF